MSVTTLQVNHQDLERIALTPLGLVCGIERHFFFGLTEFEVPSVSTAFLKMHERARFRVTDACNGGRGGSLTERSFQCALGAILLKW